MGALYISVRDAQEECCFSETIPIISRRVLTTKSPIKMYNNQNVNKHSPIRTTHCHFGSKKITFITIGEEGAYRTQKPSCTLSFFVFRNLIVFLHVVREANTHKPSKVQVPCNNRKLALPSVRYSLVQLKRTTRPPAFGSSSYLFLFLCLSHFLI